MVRDLVKSIVKHSVLARSLVCFKGKCSVQSFTFIVVYKNSVYDCFYKSDWFLMEVY